MAAWSAELSGEQTLMQFQMAEIRQDEWIMAALLLLLNSVHSCFEALFYKT